MKTSMRGLVVIFTNLLFVILVKLMYNISYILLYHRIIDNMILEFNSQNSKCEIPDLIYKKIIITL